jgi:hypothetical protein
VGTIKGVAQKFGVHRRMVREALADAVPKQRRRTERARPRLEPFILTQVGNHDALHYGNLATYLRLNGSAPLGTNI